ncbi:MAG: spore coat U domain-containing protein [Burkholderiaceae bacterium]|jgi:spore coat protein U-like protein|nr:spore coat U domain-containing protein [Burkholderiaceae bacterium]
MNRSLAAALKFVAVFLLLVTAHGRAYAQASCSVSVTPLNFGAYTGNQVQVTGTVDLTCSGPSGTRVNYSIAASPGNSNNYAQRFMRRSLPPVETLNYSLTILLGTTTANWGDGSNGTSAWTGRTPPINAGNPQRIATTTITGTVAAGPVPSSGSYVDVITVTATWN